MNDWKQQLRKYNSIKEELAHSLEKRKGKLRFDRSFIVVSDVAEQYYCEKKVEMQYLHGEVETEAKLLGALAHEKLREKSIKIDVKNLWKEIFGIKPIIAQELPLFAKYKDLILAGSPDSVLFYRGLPWIVFEFKFSSLGRPFNSHHVQVATYCILLKEMGFNTDNLYYAIIIANPKAKDDKEFKKKVVNMTLEKGLENPVLVIENARIYLYKFNPTKAEQDLDWAKEFWEKKREAVPTKNLNKCKSCEYNKECEKALLVSNP